MGKASYARDPRSLPACRWFGAQAVAVVALACAFTKTASATDPGASDRETSRSLGAQGMQALEAHDYAAAERTCGGAYALVKAPTTATCWARALEELGHLVEARDVFEQTLHLPATPDEPAVFISARELARAEADGLAKRIPAVTLAISGPPETTPLQVILDGVSVKSETARLPRKVNPGRHALTVSAPGFEPVTLEVTIAEREERRVEVMLRPSSGGSLPVLQGAPSVTSVRPLPMLAIAAGGIGLAGLVVGVGAGVTGSSKHSVLSGECNTASGTCPSSAANDLDAFHAWRAVSTIGYVVGAAGVAAGAVLFLTVPSPRALGPAGTTALYVGPASCGLTGAF